MVGGRQGTTTCLKTVVGGRQGTTTCLKTVAWVKTSGQPHVLKLWLVVGKGMLPVNTFTPTEPLFASLECHGDHKSFMKLGLFCPPSVLGILPDVCQLCLFPDYTAFQLSNLWSIYVVRVWLIFLEFSVRFSPTFHVSQCVKLAKGCLICFKMV